MVKLIVVAGFLGAGKTSSIAALGRHFLAEGKKVGVVTNDQGKNLVDTNFLKDTGLAVFEITNGCFCCNFNEFTAKLESVTETQMPDIILAEPIGSCTNLIATIFKPIMNSYAKKFNLSPLSVVCDPKRVYRLMRDEKNNFSNEVNYLFEKQLEEADIIALNKIDTLTENQISALTAYLAKKYPAAQVITVSAAEKTGLRPWLNTLMATSATEKDEITVDYDIHTRAEAALGWLNTFTTLESPTEINFNPVITQILDSMKETLKEKQAEIAHVKVYAVSGHDFAKAGLTATDDMTSFNTKMTSAAKKVNLIINARVETDPKTLTLAMETAMEAIISKFSLTAMDTKTDAYSPDYEKPSCGGASSC